MTGALLGMAAVAQGAQTADVLFLVDESGSMAGEHAWLSGMVTDLDAGLVGAGVTGNQYALVGFGGTDAAGQLPHAHTVGGGSWGTAAELSTATGSLVASGGIEDGWNAIDYALSTYSFRGNAALNIVLITDEDRDNQNAALSYAGVLSQLQGHNAKLNVVVNASLSGGALGIYENGADSSYLADGSGGFTKTAGGSVVSDFGTTKEDYIDMALATDGAAWDLNKLRTGGLTATSFTAGFVDLKVQEIQQQQPVVPEPTTVALFGIGLLTLAGLARRKN